VTGYFYLEGAADRIAETFEAAEYIAIGKHDSQSASSNSISRSSGQPPNPNRRAVDPRPQIEIALANALKNRRDSR